MNKGTIKDEIICNSEIIDNYFLKFLNFAVSFLQLFIIDEGIYYYRCQK